MFRDSGFARLLRRSGIAKIFSRRMEFALALLESSSPRAGMQSSEASTSNLNPATAGRALLFSGCVGSGLFSRVNAATARVLTVNGFAVETPSKQVCCGALHAHAGDLEGARQLARQNIAAFAVAEIPIVTNAGGCGAMLASYGHLLADNAAFAEQAQQFSARVRDVSQQLETVTIEQASETTEAVTYDASCHLLYGQHAGEAPLKMLGATGQLNFTRLEGSERCCGGAGIYNLMEADLSSQVLNEKLANIRATGANVLATGNPGCQMQIGAGALLAGMDLRTCHPVELLDEAYARAGKYKEGMRAEG